MRFFIVLIALLVAVSAQASKQNGVSITMLMMDAAENKKERLFIQTDTPYNESFPECAKSGRWMYVLPVTDPHFEKMYSMLLMAFASGKTVNLAGINDCTKWVDIETLGRIEVVN